MNILVGGVSEDIRIYRNAFNYIFLIKNTIIKNIYYFFNL